jgi:LuxR family maltose regulon positive regulatory protein
VANAIIEWVENLPKAVKDARPSLWMRAASMTLVAGQTTGVAERLQAAETALQNFPNDPQTRTQTGRIASARSVLALTQYRADEIFIQARRALEHLAPEDLTYRFTAHWTMGFAYFMQSNRAAALQAYQEALTLALASGEIFSAILATSGVGNMQELQNQLHEAAETYQRILPQGGEHPIPAFTDVYLGLARLHYEWNNLALAQEYGEKSLHLALQYDKTVDRFLINEVLLARLKLALGDDAAGARLLLNRAREAALQPYFAQRLPEVVANLVIALLRVGDIAAAGQFAEIHPVPTSRARVLLARGDAAAALAILNPLREQMQAQNWQDEGLKTLILQALALRALGEKARARQTLEEALTLAEPGGFIRIFVDEGEPMKLLMTDFWLWTEKSHQQPPTPDYVKRILSAFGLPQALSTSRNPQAEMLSSRELDVLRLIAQGLSNQEISSQLFLALSTVKSYNQKIFDKLQAQNRTEAAF